MKRFVFALILLTAVICFNIFCLETTKKIQIETTEKLDELYITLISGNYQKTALECEKFTEYWLLKQHVMSRIIRHDLLDRITVSVSGFVPLFEFGETGELASEISRCKILIEEIYDSERPLLRNIL